MRYLLTLLSLFVPTIVGATVTTLAEGIPSTKYTIFVDTGNQRTNHNGYYTGSVASVGVFSSSNVVVSTPSSSSNIVLYATGTVHASKIEGSIDFSTITNKFDSVGSSTQALAVGVSTTYVKLRGDTMTGKLFAPDISLTYGISAATENVTTSTIGTSFVTGDATFARDIFANQLGHYAYLNWIQSTQFRTTNTVFGYMDQYINNNMLYMDSSGGSPRTPLVIKMASVTIDTTLYMGAGVQTSTIANGNAQFPGAVTAGSFIGSIDFSTITTKFNAVGVSTLAITNILNTLGTSTTALSASTVSLATNLVNVGISTGGLQASKLSTGTAIPTNLVDLSTVTTKFDSVGASTLSITNILNTLGTSTTTLSASTVSIISILNTVGTSTKTLSASTVTLASNLVTVGVSTGALELSKLSTGTAIPTNLVDLSTVTTKFDSVGTSTKTIAQSTQTLANTIATSTTAIGVSTGVLSVWMSTASQSLLNLNSSTSTLSLSTATLSVSTASLLTTKLSSPTAGGSVGQFLRIKTDGTNEWATASSGSSGHSITTGTLTAGATPYTTRAELRFDNTFINAIDSVTGGFTYITLATAGIYASDVFLTAGTSATWTVPANIYQIEGEMCGGGGGGGAGYSGGTTGANGSSTTFNGGVTPIVANGGTSGPSNTAGFSQKGGAGGTGGYPAQGVWSSSSVFRTPGDGGCSGVEQGAGGVGVCGGSGLWGGAPTGSANTVNDGINGTAPAVNTCAGGTAGVGSSAAGGGGGAGENVRFRMNVTPGQVITYTIGTAGAASTGATFNGAAGGSGAIKLKLIPNPVIGFPIITTVFGSTQGYLPTSASFVGGTAQTSIIGSTLTYISAGAVAQFDADFAFKAFDIGVTVCVGVLFDGVFIDGETNTSLMECAISMQAPSGGSNGWMSFHRKSKGVQTAGPHTVSLIFTTSHASGAKVPFDLGTANLGYVFSVADAISTMSAVAAITNSSITFTAPEVFTSTMMAVAGVSIGTNTSPTTRLTVYGVVTSSSVMGTLACNAGTPTATTAMTDDHGTYLSGVAAVNCTYTFKTPWPKTPVCVCGTDAAVPIAVSATATTTSIKCTAAAALTGDNISYLCMGAP